MDIDELMLECEEKMENTLRAFKETLQRARTGRANPKMLEGVKIDYYGVETPINQVAGISVPEATQLYIKPYDKSVLLNNWLPMALRSSAKVQTCLLQLRPLRYSRKLASSTHRARLLTPAVLQLQVLR